jgi:outer membrane protein OmpA-like peptidoglycan-associated protein
VEVALVGAVMALILLLHPPAPTEPAEAPKQVAVPAPVVEEPPKRLEIPKPRPLVTRELVVVLPDANGRTGTVVVERGAERIVLNEPYATSRITADGQIHFEKLPEREVRASFEPVVTALPARPMSFLLYFVRGSDTLTEDSKSEHERMLSELRRRSTPDIVVIGHTDRVGKDQANDQLSLQRAERVKADLTSQGIASESIRTAGRGEREPVVATGDGVDEPRNRRVEISVR